MNKKKKKEKEGIKTTQDVNKETPMTQLLLKIPMLYPFHLTI